MSVLTPRHRGTPNKHLNYGAPEGSTGTPVFARGPVSTELDFLASPVCLHDDVTTDPVEDSQLDLYFDTPPPVHGGFQLEQTYGCLECALAKYILAHSQATVPAQPAGDAPSTIQYTGDPVNVSTGTLTESFTDISLPGPGIPFQLLRSYNSRDTTSGVMGPGWTNALVASLSIDGSGNVTYRSGDGQQVKFTKNGTNYIGRTDLVLKKPTGSTYTITTPDQRVLTFDTSGNLTQAKSRFGPATTFSYSGRPVDRCHRLGGTVDHAQLHEREADVGHAAGQSACRLRLYQRAADRRHGFARQELDAGLRRQRFPGVDRGSAGAFPASGDLRQPGPGVDAAGRGGERDRLRLHQRRHLRHHDGFAAQPRRLYLQVDQEPAAERDRPARPDNELHLRHRVPRRRRHRSAWHDDQVRVRPARKSGQGDAASADLLNSVVDL